MSNPAMRESVYQEAINNRGMSPGEGGGDVMTVNGVVGKAAIVGLLVAITFMAGWNLFESTNGGIAIWGAAAMLLGVVMSFVISFKPHLAPVLTPIFALVEGFFLGVVSAMYAHVYEGIVPLAAVSTIGVFLAVLVLYRTRVIRVTERMRSVVFVAMMSAFLIYGASFVMSMFGGEMPIIYDSSGLGIAWSVLVIVIASFMLLINFADIDRFVSAGAPSSLEWYSAFALLVSIVWIYLEMLNLLSKLMRD